MKLYLAYYDEPDDNGYNIGKSTMLMTQEFKNYLLSLELHQTIEFALGEDSTKTCTYKEFVDAIIFQEVDSNFRDLLKFIVYEVSCYGFIQQSIFNDHYGRAFEYAFESIRFLDAGFGEALLSKNFICNVQKMD